MSVLIDYRFWYHPEIELSLRDGVARYNGEHDEPANRAWMCKEDYKVISGNGIERELGIRVAINPCGKERGNVMVGRVS